MLTNVLKPSQTQPRDLSNRLLARLYPGDGMAQAPKSPTGLPISTPPPPAPVMSRDTMAAPSYSPNAMAPPPVAAPTSAPAGDQQGSISSLTNPQSTGNPMGMIGGFSQQHKAPDPYGDLPWDQQVALKNAFDSLAGIDYKGSRESAALQQKMLADLFRGWNMEGPVDYTSAAPLADQFGHSRDQLSASLAARGLNGGVVGGALSNSYSQEARGIGDYIRQLIQERQRQHHDDYQRFLDKTYGLNAKGLQQNIDEQNSGGFWDTLAGVGGSLLGGLIP